MIDGLKLTFSGEELRTLLEDRIADHNGCADHWRREQARTPESETEDAPLLPEHMCENEEQRHVWRADVLEFIRDHVDPHETYRLSADDLEFGELLPSKPGWMEQEEYEERRAIGFQLERLTKQLGEHSCRWVPDEAAGEMPRHTGERLDIEDPEVVRSERTDAFE
jgi:hypothetical protein